MVSLTDDKESSASKKIYCSLGNEECNDLDMLLVIVLLRNVGYAGDGLAAFTTSGHDDVSHTLHFRHGRVGATMSI